MCAAFRPPFFPHQRSLTYRAFLRLYTLLRYIVVQNLELKKGSAELMILSLVEEQPRHGYDIGRLIEQRSGGTVKFRVASLYPLLYRMEQRGWIHGRWVEKAGQRRRRYYHLTKEGRHVLAAQRRGWLEFVQAINCIAGLENA